MRTFAILLLCLNLLYLAWNLGWLGDRQALSQPEVLVRPVGQQASQSLVLLSELGEELSLRNVVEDEDSAAAMLPLAGDNEPDQSAVQSEESAALAQCSEVWGFSSLAEAGGLTQALSMLGHPANIEQSAQQSSTFRVFMPPFVSTAGRNQTFAELQARGIESFIMTTGDLAQGISLGVFSTEAAAAALQERLAAQGYASSIREQIRDSGDIRVQIGAPAALVQTLELWGGLEERNPGLNLAEKLCETIAPED